MCPHLHPYGPLKGTGSRQQLLIFYFNAQMAAFYKGPALLLLLNPFWFRTILFLKPTGFHPIEGIIYYMVLVAICN